jgi:ArsR family transcriptional regulator
MFLEPRETAAIRVAKALSDPTRFRLLRAIAAREELSCQELTALFPISQATVSHHLKVLSEAGLVAVRQEGTFHYYRALREALDAHAADLVALAGGPRRGRAGARATERAGGGRR